MKTPPLLLGAALMFWGWQAGMLWLGAVAGVLVESPHWLKVRWHFTQADLDRVWNLCVALFLGGTVYAFLSGDNLAAMGDLIKDNSSSSRLATINQSKRSLFQLLQWLPVLFLPMAVAQAFAEQSRFDLSTFSLWLRRKRAEPGYAQRYPAGLNVGYPYFACCVFGASAGSQRSLGFSVGLVALVAWALWMNRSRTFSPVGWVASLLLALGFGFAVQMGLLEVQKALQQLDEILLARWSGARNFDAKENQTRIGSIGRMKLSGRIVLRVYARNQDAPALLREASYDIFHAPIWSSTRREFERITPEVNQTSWILQTAAQSSRTATIAGYMPGGTGLLPLPNGVGRVEQLPAFAMATNHFGSVRVEDGPGFVQFETAYGTGRTIDSPPTKADWDIPLAEESVTAQIAQELQLAQLEPKEAARRVEQFFAQHFTYSTWQGREHQRKAGRSALSRFLLEHRSGHCEYFATATVLLLRAAKIPARYAIGYSVQEKSGRSYVVRERHAHAWCLAWINGAWREVDTTPGTWATAEARHASFWEPVRDLLSRLWFEFSKWRWGHAEWKQYLLWLLVPVVALAFGKVLLKRQWGRARSLAPRGLTPPAWPGLDSEFYLIEQQLSDAGFARHSGETGSAWLQRIRKSGTFSVNGLDSLLAGHYRLRFDPRGLSAAERSRIRKECHGWLRQSTRITR